MKMKRILWILLVLILSACDPSPTNPDPDDRVDVSDPEGPCPHLDAIGDWEPVWCDEFDYVGLPDDTLWSYDVGGHGWGNNELQYYTEEDTDNAYSDGEFLTITARRESMANNDYTSARLVTRDKGDWRYGRVEVRAKLPSGRGTWPAIWMLPTEWVYGGWPDSGEIDIMEHVGYDPNTVFATIHTGAYNHMLGTQIGFEHEDETLETSFHVYSMEWEPGLIKVFIDNIHYATFTFVAENNINRSPDAAWPFDQTFHLILNIAVGGSWGGVEGVDPDIWPQELVIDYVRVYQQDYAGRDETDPSSITELRSLSTTTNSFYLTWDEADDDVGIDLYQVFVNGELHGTTSVDAYYLEGLTPATTYDIGVVPVDFAGRTATITTIALTTADAPLFQGRIEAEDYVRMEGIQTQTTTDTGGGENVGWTDMGDSLTYVLDVETAGTYRLTYRVASESTGGRFLLKLNEADTIDDVTFAATGGWQNWVDVTGDTFVLEAGTHVFTIYFQSAGTNLNYFDVERVD
jgi:beta-glucanase (GH16 family)